jgi:hypothetical protein
MKFLLPIAAAAAAIAVVAIVLSGRFLPNDPNVGVPTSSPTPSPTPAYVGGSYVFAGDAPVTIDALSDGSSLSGTVEGEWGGTPFGIRLQCLRQFDDTTWMLAGELTQSAEPARQAGDWGAVIVRDGSPQQTGVWTAASAAGDNCDEFVREIPDMAVEGFESIGPMDEGSVALPPELPGGPVSGDITFKLGDSAATANVDARASGATLTGTAHVVLPEGGFTLGLRCLRRFDDATWVLGGSVDASSAEAQPVGSLAALIVREGPPQEVALYFEVFEGDCGAFVDGIAADAIGSATFSPVEDGELTLP